MAAQDTSKGKTVYWVISESDGKHIMEGLVEESTGGTTKVRAVRDWWRGGTTALRDSKPVNMSTMFFEESIDDMAQDSELGAIVASIVRR
jgi:hypothetical protein